MANLGYGTNPFWESAEVVKDYGGGCRVEYNPSVNQRYHWRTCERGIIKYHESEGDALNYALQHGWYRKEELNG